MTNTKTNKLLNALKDGEEITARQAISRFGFTSTDAVRATISSLRLNEGYPVFRKETKDTHGRVKRKYYLASRAPRRVVAAGYRALSLGLI